IAFEVGFVFGAEAFDDVAAGSGVARIMENERVAEDTVFAVDVDGDFAGAGLAGRAGALVAEADGTGGFHRGSLLELGLAAGLAIPPARRRGGGEWGARPHGGSIGEGAGALGSRFRRADLRQPLRVKRALRSAKLGEPCDGPADPRGAFLGREGERPPSPQCQRS